MIVTGSEIDLWEDIELQLELAERQFRDEGVARHYAIPGCLRVRVSHKDGSDILSISGSNRPAHTWRLALGAVSIQRREIVGLGDGFNGISLQVRYDSEDRARLVPFLADIVDLVVSESDTDEAFEIVLEDWGERFRSIRAPLSLEEQRGLFGELCVLRELIRSEVSNAVTSWRGPERSLHDFVTADWHIEVKTSTTNPGRLKIHPLNQLEPIAEDFFLVMVHISQGEEESLPDLIETMRRMLVGMEGGQEHLERMLAIQGYRDSDSDIYDRTYTLNSFHSLEISDETPILHRIRIDPDIACIQSLRWIMRTESLDFLRVEEEFWGSLR